ncbi:hypothetical protein SISNIDRAFT_418509 [Sistotremastrum niveocremeum HHB9708]|uniref:hAT-like transposase RNase-H fold domain-containing protein n=1 Tax=Sistotremastrum niveocremeum HHB9708 TaxID=1314777 RepID=A0A164NYH3_9AGAM|nr:hypothetical protein SISNIDRAFT_418509 [Sistotremastrum niveocremeum HHB9708]
MCRKSYELRTAIDLFVNSADALFGPITTIAYNGGKPKSIAWKAFCLSVQSWLKVLRVTEILEDADSIQHFFSSDKVPTFYRLVPAVEELLTQWESKLEEEDYEDYREGLTDAIAKVRKYYCKYDDKPAIVLSMAIHPHYKLMWIECNWGGAETQAEEIAAGDPDAKNWHDEARKTLESTVCTIIPGHGHISRVSRWLSTP